MSAGSITVICLAKSKKLVRSISTLKSQEFNTNCIMLLNHVRSGIIPLEGSSIGMRGDHGCPLGRG
jgi:hypothetical protein